MVETSQTAARPPATGTVSSADCSPDARGTVPLHTFEYACVVSARGFHPPVAPLSVWSKMTPFGGSGALEPFVGQVAVFPDACVVPSGSVAVNVEPVSVTTTGPR